MSEVASDPFARAIFIEADDSLTGTGVEYIYIARQCGEPLRDWKFSGQRFEEYQGKPYDVISVTLTNGELRTFYFDISRFFGK
jgi:hypothetical protein